MTAWRDIHRSTVVVTPPAAEPLSRTEAKLYLQVDITADDPLIDALIIAAREQIENDTNRTLVSTVYDLWLDRFPTDRAIELSRSPVSAVASVTSYDDNDAASVLAVSNYFADLKSEPGRVVLTDSGVWPTDLRSANAGVVRFTAGYSVGIPVRLLQAMKLWMLHLYRPTADNDEMVQRVYRSLISDRVVTLG